jgi:uroporphyrinogen-III synthase
MTPQSRAIPVILTRPAAQGDRFASALRERFGEAVQVIQSPLIAPVFLPATLPPENFRAVILTSETGAEAAARLPDLPRLAWCVGDRTAATARSLGFDARSAAGDADALVAAILAAGLAGPLIHLRGRDSRGDVAARLTRAGVATAEVEVYAQAPQPPSAEAKALLRGAAPVVVPLFSPRTATIFAGTRPTAPLFIAALSPAVAAAVAELPTRRIVTASRPDAAAMVEALVPLIDAARA